MESSIENETDWIARAKAGDASAFGRLVNAHQRGVFGYLLGCVREAAVADDLTQDTFLRAWQGLPRFRGESAFRAWLFQIAANRVRSWARWRSLRLLRETALPASSDGTDPLEETAVAGDPGPEEEACIREQRERLRAAIGVLPPREKEVFLLRHDGNLPIKEIAGALGIAEGSVKAHLFHALEKLRKALEETR